MISRDVRVGNGREERPTQYVLISRVQYVVIVTVFFFYCNDTFFRIFLTTLSFGETTDVADDVSGPRRSNTRRFYRARKNVRLLRVYYMVTNIVRFVTKRRVADIISYTPGNGFTRFLVAFNFEITGNTILNAPSESVVVLDHSHLFYRQSGNNFLLLRFKYNVLRK